MSAGGTLDDPDTIAFLDGEEGDTCDCWNVSHGVLPSVPCPYCGTACACWQDGPHQIGPYYCDACGAMQGGTWDTREDFEEAGDRATGWYPPGSATAAAEIGGGV